MIATCSAARLRSSREPFKLDSTKGQNVNYLRAIQDAEAAKNAALAQLHLELGYATPQALADAIIKASGTKMPPLLTDSAPKGAGVKGKRIPDETRKAIASALRGGEVGSSLSAKFGVSYNIVHAIKTELGMVKPHKKNRRKKS